MEQTVVFWALDDSEVARVRKGELGPGSIWAESDLEGIAPPKLFYVGCGVLVWLAVTGCIALPWLVLYGAWPGFALSLGAMIAIAVGLVRIRRNTIQQALAEIKLTLPDQYRFATPHAFWIEAPLADTEVSKEFFIIGPEVYATWDVSEHVALAQFLDLAGRESRNLCVVER